MLATLPLKKGNKSKFASIHLKKTPFYYSIWAFMRAHDLLKVNITLIAGFFVD